MKNIRYKGKLHGNFYFVQFTDIHIGTIVAPEMTKLNLQWALNEVNSFAPAPEIILCTGDCVCNGVKSELEEFKKLMDTSGVPFIDLPANHDLWGEDDDSVWENLIGPVRQSKVAGNFKFLLWNDIKRTECGWKSLFTEEDEKWLTAELEDAASRGLQVIAGVHNPPDFQGNYSTSFTRWSDEDTGRLFSLLAKYGVKALISGVWTGGPRPIIRPMHIFAGATLQVDTFSKHFEIESVSWSLDDRDWHPMRKVWSGLWEQWEADFHPEEYRNGEYLCRVRAEVKGGSNAEFTDSVPVIVCPRNAPRGISPVVAGNLQTYQTFHFPFD